MSGSEGERGEEGEGEGEGEGEVIDVNDLPAETPPTATMTTTVVIDPPDDQMDSQVALDTSITDSTSDTSLHQSGHSFTCNLFHRAREEHGHIPILL